MAYVPPHRRGGGSGAAVAFAQPTKAALKKASVKNEAVTLTAMAADAVAPVSAAVVTPVSLNPDTGIFAFTHKPSFLPQLIKVKDYEQKRGDVQTRFYSLSEEEKQSEYQEFQNLMTDNGIRDAVIGEHHFFFSTKTNFHWHMYFSPRDFLNIYDSTREQEHLRKFDLKKLASSRVESMKGKFADRIRQNQAHTTNVWDSDIAPFIDDQGLLQAEHIALPVSDDYDVIFAQDKPYIGIQLKQTASAQVAHPLRLIDELNRWIKQVCVRENTSMPGAQTAVKIGSSWLGLIDESEFNPDAFAYFSFELYIKLLPLDSRAAFIERFKSHHVQEGQRPFFSSPM